MKHFDVFNGDADGIVSLLQLRLAEPRNAELVTGIKRDISLVKNIDILDLTESSQVTILDISMEKNGEALQKVLRTGANVFYADHHRPGDVPSRENLEAQIDLDANTCTALIVDKFLCGRFRYWAIVAAYGDNLIQVADKLALESGLSAVEAEKLKELGTLINYNGYGAAIEDLAYHPADLFISLLKYKSPFDCIEDQDSAYHVLKKAFASDFNKAESADVLSNSELCKAVLLEDAAWSRRISGTFGNHLANLSPSRAHLVVTTVDEDNYLISLRAPLNNKIGAGDICSRFDTGGGRAGAAGINLLPKAQLSNLLQAVEEYYS